jgi:hypothetical protein
MDHLFLALLEASLLNKAGLAAPTLFEEMAKAHSDNDELKTLFEELVEDFENPKEEDPLVAPLRSLERVMPEYMLARAFTELSDSGMVEPYWTQAAQAYALQKAVKSRRPTEADIEFACTLLAYFSAEHSIRKYFRALTPQPAWTNGLKNIPEELPDFDKWAAQFKIGKVPKFSTLALVKEICAKNQMPELAEEIEAEWQRVAGVIAGL